MSSHAELILQAKKNQASLLQQSQARLRHLVLTVSRILSSNSAPSTSPAITKITTIHELDKGIDSQLNENVLPHLQDLNNANVSINRLISKTKLKLQKHCRRDSGATLQTRAEQIDLSLRILEQTAKFIDHPE